MKNNKIPWNAFELPHKYRFTFVPEGSAYFEGTVIFISENIKTQRQAFYVACEKFRQENTAMVVSVFFGDVESPDVTDKLYKAYSHFAEKKKLLLFSRKNKERRIKNEKRKK